MEREWAQGGEVQTGPDHKPSSPGRGAFDCTTICRRLFSSSGHPPPRLPAHPSSQPATTRWGRPARVVSAVGRLLDDEAVVQGHGPRELEEGVLVEHGHAQHAQLAVVARLVLPVKDDAERDRRLLVLACDGRA